MLSIIQKEVKASDINSEKYILVYTVIYFACYRLQIVNLLSYNILKSEMTPRYKDIDLNTLCKSKSNWETALHNKG
jgi:hypothetical protein